MPIRTTGVQGVALHSLEYERGVRIGQALRNGMMRKNYYTDDNPQNPLEALLWFIFLTAMLLVAGVLMTSCKTTKVVTVEHVRTDTTYITKEQRDSIWLHDSIYMHEWTSADTVYVLQEKWHTKYKEKVVRDTIYQAKVDSVPVPYEVVKEVRKPLRWYEKIMIGWGIIALIVAFVVSLKRWP